MVKQFYRDMDNKKLCGICAGAAEYFELDVNLVRCLAILTAFCGGLGIIAYIVGAVMLPEKPR